MQKYIRSDYPLLKNKVAKVYTTRSLVDLVYGKDNIAITLDEIVQAGSSYIVFHSNLPSRQLVQEYYLSKEVEDIVKITTPKYSLKGLLLKNSFAKQLKLLYNRFIK